MMNNYVLAIFNKRPVTVLDILDIAVLALLFYFVFRFIRERRAGKLAAGVLMLIVVEVLAHLLHLNALEFILSNLFQVGLIALIILFQPELRSVLEKMGSQPIDSLKSITDQKNSESTRKMIKNVSVAVGDLAANKTGALIVIERSTKLGDVTRSGVPINADPVPALIKNIFYNKAPLHDGAMIIRGDKIAAAGCFLTNTNRLDIPEDLGSRHRAAIGASEICDAAIIVVSEETGTISLALEGQLIRGFTKNSLEKELIRILCGSKEADGKEKESTGFFGKVKNVFKKKKKDENGENRKKEDKRDE